MKKKQSTSSQAAGCLVLLVIIGAIYLMSQNENPPKDTPPAATATPPGYVQQEDYGKAWAFTVDEGVIECRTGNRVVFVSEGKTYALNGLARGWAERMGWLDIDQIWRDNPDGITPKIDISPFIELGLSLCNGTSAQPPTAAPAQAAATATMQPMWISQSANVRSCSALTCDVVEALPAGTMVLMRTYEHGETVSGSDLWYEVLYGNQVVYIHSSLLSEKRIQLATAQPVQQALPVASPVQPAAGVRPKNCAEAVAMGLSDVEAAQWDHLDRDHDGVACYGD